MLSNQNIYMVYAVPFLPSHISAIYIALILKKKLIVLLHIHVYP